MKLNWIKHYCLSTGSWKANPELQIRNIKNDSIQFFKEIPSKLNDQIQFIPSFMKFAILLMN